MMYRIWPLTLFMMQYLFNTPELVRGQCCLELGAGSGLLSLGIMVLRPAKLVSTEVSQRCRRLMSINLMLNGFAVPECVVSSLKFGRSHGAASDRMAMLQRLIHVPCDRSGKLSKTEAVACDGISERLCAVAHK